MNFWARYSKVLFGNTRLPNVYTRQGQECFSKSSTSVCVVRRRRCVRRGLTDQNLKVILQFRLSMFTCPVSTICYHHTERTLDRLTRQTNNTDRQHGKVLRSDQKIHQHRIYLNKLSAILVMTPVVCLICI